MPKLLLVLNDGEFFLSHRLAFSAKLREAGFDVAVVCPPFERQDKITGAGLRFLPWKVSRKGLNPFYALKSFMDLISLYRAERPDVLHHFTIKPVILGTLARQIVELSRPGSGTPLVVNTITGLGYVFTEDRGLAKWLRPWVVLLYKLAFSFRGVHVVFQNTADQALFEDLGIRCPGGSSIIGGAGVDLSKFSPLPLPPVDPKTGPVLLLPARLLWHKGIREAAEASKLARSQGARFELHLAGSLDSGNPAAIPERQVREWEASGSLRWIGHADDMPSELARRHGVLLPSYREGLPLALLEGAASARPLITTDAPGCRDVVDGGEVGWMVPVGDIPALAKALTEWAQDEGKRERLAEAARRRATAEYGLDQVTARYVAIYREGAA